MRKIYLISGLGADASVFSHLNLPNYELIHIPWEIPFHDETLHDYSARIGKNVEEGSIILGLSFGGIVAQEIAVIKSAKAVVLISSVKSADELDWKLNLVKKTGLNEITPMALIRLACFTIGSYIFGAETEEDKKLLKTIARQGSAPLMVWSIQQIMGWHGAKHICPVIHIHGTEDRIFPVSKIKNYIPVIDGGHLMILNKSEKVSSLVLEELRKLNF